MCKQRVDLDDAMKIAKHDGHEQVLDVAGVSEEQAHKLDHLGEAEHERKLRPERILPGLRIPFLRRPPAGIEKQGVDNKCKRCEGSDVQGVC